MTNVRTLTKNEARELYGGGYRCRICGYYSWSFTKVYTHALMCMLKALWSGRVPIEAC